jgi:hypothetical protein
VEITFNPRESPPNQGLRLPLKNKSTQGGPSITRKMAKSAANLQKQRENNQNVAVNQRDNQSEGPENEKSETFFHFPNYPGTLINTGFALYLWWLLQRNV